MEIMPVKIVTKLLRMKTPKVSKRKLYMKIRNCIVITLTMKMIVYLIKNAYFCTKLQNHADMGIVARESFVCSDMMTMKNNYAQLSLCSAWLSLSIDID